MNITKKYVFAAVLALVLEAPFLIANEAADLRPIGNMGKKQEILKEGKEVVLFEHEGKGCMTHFWFGGNFAGVEDTRIRYYVDGEKMPSIDMDLYMGHGIGFNDNHAPWSNKHMGKIGKRNGIFNNYRIPFGKSIRVTAQRSPDSDGSKFIWWIIRGVENGRVRLGGVELPETARLKLHRVENQVFKPLEEFDLCKVTGAGALYQVTIAGKALNAKRMSFLEACMRGYLNGSEQPMLISSGLEDYFLGTYYFDTGRFHSDTAGLTHLDKKNMSFSAYRFHDEDPIFYQDGLRLTCRNGETEYGTLEGEPYLNPTDTEFTTYTWVYQW
jgi:hypothetical protein